MIKAEIDANAVRRLSKELNLLEPGLARQIGKDFKSELGEFTGAIQGRMPVESPLSNMARGLNDNKWSPARVTIVGGLGAGFGKPIVAVQITGSPRAKPLAVAEFAGISGKRTVTSQGEAFNRNLESKFPFLPGKARQAGRFGFRAYRQEGPKMFAVVVKIIERYVDIVNKGFN
jgi:hypothetical protein